MQHHDTKADPRCDTAARVDETKRTLQGIDEWETGSTAVQQRSKLERH